MAKKELVYTVNKVEARLDGNVLNVHAWGATRTGGWKDAKLQEQPGTGDEKVFHFVATPPDGPSTDSITPIEAKYVSGPLLPPFPRSVRVKAETNEEKAPIT